jgi:hypothetical protein
MATKSTGGRKAAAKRTLLKPKSDARFIRRDEQGRIRESDDVGRSLRQDRAKKAKTAVKAGQGDRGDRKAAGSARKRTSSR